METHHRRFWAKVYFTVSSDLFPGLWQLRSVTFTSIQPIDASLITEKASLWLCAISHEFNEPVRVERHVWKYGLRKAECQPN